MFRKLLFVFVLVGVLGTSSVVAQEKRVEIVPFFGYTLSEGVGVQAIDIEGAVYDRVTPKSGMAYGVAAGYYLTENWEFEFQWSQQQSKLEGSGPGVKTEFTDMKVNNYHGNMVFNAGEEDDTIRPYLFGGLGATNYSPSQAQGQSVGSSTRFSTNWGGGVKIMPSESIGIRLGGRWTPTYIKSDATGWWCGWYGCWLVGEAKYSHALELSAGVVVRF